MKKQSSPLLPIKNLRVSYQKKKILDVEDWQIETGNFLEAPRAGQGHLDCQGLILSREGKITLLPVLINENKEVSLTHEASIGKIKEAMFAYLRARGFSKKKAISLLVTGFLK